MTLLGSLASQHLAMQIVDKRVNIVQQLLIEVITHHMSQVIRQFGYPYAEDGDAVEELPADSTQNFDG